MIKMELKDIKKKMKNNQKLKIGIDLDDTIWKFHKSFFEYYNDKFGTNHNFEKYFIYSLEKFLNIDAKKVFELLDEFTFSKFGKELELMEGVKEIILKLNDEHEIYFMTARHEGIADLTKNQLKNIFGVDIPILFVFDKEKNIIKEKVDYCMEKNIDILIDDRVKTLKSCLIKGIKTILITQPWNIKEELMESMIRVNNWNEVLEEIEK